MTLGVLKTSMCRREGGESEADKPNRTLAPRMDRRHPPVAVHRLPEGCEASIPLQQHEYYHWRQAVQWGVVPWYLAYVILLPFY